MMRAYPPGSPCPSLTVDTVIFTLRDSRLQVLLVQRKEEPFFGMWALPGGFVCLEESLETAALRVLKDETGLKKAYLEQLYTFGDVDRDPRGRVVTVAYFALIATDAHCHVEGDDQAHQAGWFPIDELPALAFDHSAIIHFACLRLRERLEYSAIGFELLPDEFTLSELQVTYELILGKKLDKRNFRRRILDSQVIEMTPNMRSGDGRPAHLFRYHSEAVADVKFVFS